MDKKAILIVHNYYKIPGGEDTVVANEKKLLEDNGHRVVLYTRNNSEIEKFSFLKKLFLPISSIFNLKTYRDIKRIIKNENIDIVHVHNTLTLISPSVYYVAIKKKVPVVQTIHNFRLICPGATFYREGHICEDCCTKGLHCAIKHSCYRSSKLQSVVSVLILKIHRMLGIYKKIDYICLTEFNKQKLLLHPQIKESQIYVKPNFTYHNDNEKIIPYEKRKKQYVFVGRLDKLKGIDFLFNIWKELGAVAPKLIVCGSGPMEKWCKNFILENNVTNIEMLGQVDNNEAKAIMSQSLALILPTQWYEGFPMTIVEAYSVGTPVIVPDCGNSGNLVEEDVTGYKYNMSENKSLRAIIIKGVDPQLYCLVVENYKKKYTSTSNIKILSEIYDKVTREKRK